MTIFDHALMLGLVRHQQRAESLGLRENSLTDTVQRIYDFEKARILSWS
jgi:hypothetical protein